MDIASLDFMFYDSGADESEMTQRPLRLARRMCGRSQRQETIVELAQQNAERHNGLVKPIVEQLTRIMCWSLREGERK